MAEFLFLPNAESIPLDAPAAVPQGRLLLQAISEHEDYALVERLRRRTTQGFVQEAFVVDVCTDGVPENNKFGIRYRERLALEASDEPGFLPRAYVLRSDFPELAHLNDNGPSEPMGLCLALGPAAAALRVWTAKRFLRQIQQWLELSAKGLLHPDDQPVEQLFFVSPHEIILPPGFGEETNRTRQVDVMRYVKRGNGATTYICEYGDAGHTKGVRCLLIRLELPPIVAGHIERMTWDLQSLIAKLAKRGAPIESSIKDALKESIGDGVAKEDDPPVILLLSVPLMRIDGGPVEDWQHQAFVVSLQRRELGLRLGVFIEHKGRIYHDVLSTNPGIPAEGIGLVPLTVLHELTDVRRRAIAGYKEEGPVVAIVGVGSLGSTLLELLSRSGWGTWTVIDEDHIKPHNLVRHIAETSHVGKAKVDAVVDVIYRATDLCSKPLAICGDARDFQKPEIAKALATADLVIDASTTLEFPRKVSESEHAGRCASIFLTPSGTGSVLLLEDRTRLVRLRSLEAQYYRAVIQQPWGEHHLDGNLGTFFSGGSCRDVSTVLPYPRVATHAGLLAEELVDANVEEEARIAMWSQTERGGTIDSVRVKVDREFVSDIDGLRVYYDEGLIRNLRAFRTVNLPRETGGVLLGYYDFSLNTLTLVHALPAPDDSIATGASFIRGAEGVREAVLEAGRRTAGVVIYVGEWHSHPPGHSAAPSGDDVRQIVTLANQMADDGLPVISMIVGEQDVRIMKCEVA